MDHWFRSRLNLSPLEVLSDPYGVAVRDLPLFYQSIIPAWRAVDGSSSASLLWPLVILLLLLCVLAVRVLLPAALRSKVLAHI